MKGRPRLLTEEQEIDLVRRYVSGRESASSLALRFGMSTQGVCSLLKRRGVKRRRRGGNTYRRRAGVHRGEGVRKDRTHAYW